MKTKSLLAMVALATLLITQTSLDGATKKTKLTNEQMALLNGKGCSVWAWIAALAADVGCAIKPDPWTCLAALGTSADCISQLGGPDPVYNTTPQSVNVNPTKGAPKH
jgi:hypothetical protein